MPEDRCRALAAYRHFFTIWRVDMLMATSRAKQDHINRDYIAGKKRIGILDNLPAFDIDGAGIKFHDVFDPVTGKRDDLADCGMAHKTPLGVDAISFSSIGFPWAYTVTFGI